MSSPVWCVGRSRRTGRPVLGGCPSLAEAGPANAVRIWRRGARCRHCGAPVLAVPSAVAPALRRYEPFQHAPPRPGNIDDAQRGIRLRPSPRSLPLGRQRRGLRGGRRYPPGVVAVRDGKDRPAPVLRFGRDRWSRFSADARSGRPGPPAADRGHPRQIRLPVTDPNRRGVLPSPAELFPPYEPAAYGLFPCRLPAPTPVLDSPFRNGKSPFVESEQERTHFAS
ncbi:hypothetical protein C6W10_15050 [Plantactinospora sp. BB1]|nr:hypothetical protein C6W10_15050 [Plantactinospora sp. BB1]